ncbi:MAG TPA: phosphoenolpyruvate-utilizing N-terminal domain-containing protein, partial [Rhodopila sp.]
MNRIDPPPQQHQRLARAALAVPPARAEQVFQGIAVSAGTAIGPVFGTTEPEAVITRQKIQASDIGAERSRLEAAIAQSRKQLGKLRGRLAVLPEESQSEIAPLIDAYIRMLGPSRLVRGVRQRIEETLLSAEAAVMAEAEGIAAAIMAQAEPGLSAEDLAGLRRRADEIGEIARRLVRNLTRSPFRSFAGLPE